MCWPEAEVVLAAGAGDDDDAGFAADFAPGCVPGMTAGFTAGAGAPGAGFAADPTPAASSAALLSLACFCCSDFAMLRALSMASGFWAAASVPTAVIVIVIARMPVVSFIAVFIAIPTSSPAFPEFRGLPRKVSNRDCSTWSR